MKFSDATSSREKNSIPLWEQADREARLVPFFYTKQAKRSQIIRLCETLKKALVA